MRLLLARALVHKPDLLLLDDLFDNLNDERAHAVIANLHELPMTTVFTSWRAAELAQCDRVIFLHERHLKAVDTHKALLQNEALYSRLLNFSGVVL